jgi:hypothetical protein
MTRWILIVALGLISGCVRYYRVAEPSGGRVYFTTKIDDQSSGAIKFDDMKTGARVTLQASEVKEIKKADLPSDLQPQ